jgi:hypothetical protein
MEVEHVFARYNQIIVEMTAYGHAFFKRDILPFEKDMYPNI